MYSPELFKKYTQFFNFLNKKNFRVKNMFWDEMVVSHRITSSWIRKMAASVKLGRTRVEDFCDQKKIIFTVFCVGTLVIVSSQSEFFFAARLYLAKSPYSLLYIATHVMHEWI